MSVRSLLVAVLGALLVAAPAAGCSDETDEANETGDPQVTQSPAPTTGAPAGKGAEKPDQQGGGPSEKPPRGDSGPAEGARDDPRVTELEREAAATVRAYMSALDSRDGERVCSLLAPGAIEQVELPRPRPGCATALEASIGYRDPRGLPVWEGIETIEVLGVELGPGEAKIVVTVVSSFADRDEPSIEDDVVYLTRSAGEWLLAQPSSTLYRAVGIADLPPSVLAPPP